MNIFVHKMKLKQPGNTTTKENILNQWNFCVIPHTNPIRIGEKTIKYLLLIISLTVNAALTFDSIQI